MSSPIDIVQVEPTAVEAPDVESAGEEVHAEELAVVEEKEEPEGLMDIHSWNIAADGTISQPHDPMWKRMLESLEGLYGSDSEQLYVLKQLPLPDSEKIELVKDLMGLRDKK